MIFYSSLLSLLSRNKIVNDNLLVYHYIRCTEPPVTMGRAIDFHKQISSGEPLLIVLQ